MIKDIDAVTICAIFAVRNEAPYLARILPRLAAQRIDAVIIDNASSDETADLLHRYSGSPIIYVTHLPFLGYFSLKQQLEAKKAAIAALSHHWVIHHDADEVLEHREPGRTLRDVVEEAHRLDCNVVNFEEFTFIPEPGADYIGEDYYQAMRRYYFFEPATSRLHRAWRRQSGLDNVSRAGHGVAGPGIRMCPNTHVLRHYIALSQAHLWRKYETRVFDPTELEIGWHRNRYQLTREQLRLPERSPHIHSLGTGPQDRLCRCNPVTTHFWHWPHP